MTTARPRIFRRATLPSVAAGAAILLGASCLAAAQTPPAEPAPPTAGADADALALVRAAEQRRIDTFAAASAAVVCIFADRTAAGGGSGVLIDPAGYGLTNYHVIASFLDSRRGFGGLSDGRLYPLEVLGVDAGGDIAMFRLHGRDDFPHAPLGDANDLRPGQWIAALGNPFMLAEDFQPTISLGVVSGLHRYQTGEGNLLEYADCIQVSSSINPGNSGGPLIDLAGRVVGIVGRASFEERGRVNVGLGYAVTLNQIRRFLPGLRAGLLVPHGTLGATVALFGDDLVINAIQAGSPAERAGVRLGDVLLALDGQPVRTPNEFNSFVAARPANWPVELHVRSGAAERTLRLRLEPLLLHELVYIPDPVQNAADVRRLRAAFLRNDLQVNAPPSLLTGSLRLYAKPDEANQVAVPADAHAFVLGSPASQPATAPAEPYWPELRGALELLLDAGAGAHLRVIGGDRVDDRIASVLEQRSDDRVTRCMLDYDTGELLAISLGSPDEPEHIHWRPTGHKLFDGIRWPTVWRRSATDGSAQRLEFELVRVEPPPAAPEDEG